METIIALFAENVYIFYDLFLKSEIIIVEVFS
jgi:hypothetical protein